MKVLKLIKNPFGGIDEQAMTEQLERVIGINRCFRLKDIYTSAQNSASGNCFKFGKVMTTEEYFIRAATNNRFVRTEIDAYLDYISVV
jgi:hypothetical protein